MEKILSLLRQRLSTLNAAIKAAERDIESFPEGRLRVSVSGNSTRYYRVSAANNTSGCYIPQNQIALAKGLAQKSYNKKFLQAAKAEAENLERILVLLSSANSNAVFDALSRERKTLIRPYIVPDEVFAAEWQAAEFEKNPYMPEARIYETRRGEKVRSKSEAIIADLLDELGIPYHYEKPLKLEGGVVKYPDFTVLDVRERREIYWEHFGRLDDAEYIGRNLSKLDMYRASGVFFGKNLIATYEDDAHPLDIRGIRKMLEELFGTKAA